MCCNGCSISTVGTIRRLSFAMVIMSDNQQLKSDIESYRDLTAKLLKMTQLMHERMLHIEGALPRAHAHIRLLESKISSFMTSFTTLSESEHQLYNTIHDLDTATRYLHISSDTTTTTPPPPPHPFTFLLSNMSSNNPIEPDTPRPPQTPTQTLKEPTEEPDASQLLAEDVLNSELLDNEPLSQNTAAAESEEEEEGDAVVNVSE